MCIKVSKIISFGVNPSRGGIPPSLRIGTVKFGEIICPLGWMVMRLVLLSNKIKDITTME